MTSLQLIKADAKQTGHQGTVVLSEWNNIKTERQNDQWFSNNIFLYKEGLLKAGL